MMVATMSGVRILAVALASIGLGCAGADEGTLLVPAAPEPEAAGSPLPSSAGHPTPPAALPDFTDPSWTRVTSRGGRYLVCWRALDGRVPRNEDFELEVWVLRDGKSVEDALLSVSAWMPDHGHGMLRQPKAEARADGGFRIPGMLLHMRGHWQVFFEVLEGTLAETAECAVDL
jgi:hypothetical protein